MSVQLKSVLIVGGVFWIATSIAGAAFAQSSSAEFEISGTSTVRGWTCPAEGVMDVTPGGSNAPIPGFPAGVESVALTVPVEAIICPEEQMTDHMREAMELEEYPEIHYRLESYTFKTDDTAEATGIMTIHGTSNPITFDIRLVSSADGMRGVGEAQLDMTDYGVTPPSVWLGMLNVGEIVTIKFDALLPGAN